MVGLDILSNNISQPEYELLFPNFTFFILLQKRRRWFFF